MSGKQHTREAPASEKGKIATKAVVALVSVQPIEHGSKRYSIARCVGLLGNNLQVAQAYLIEASISKQM